MLFLESYLVEMLCRYLILCPYRLHQLSMENRVQLVSVEVSDIGEKHFFVTVYAPARGVFYTRASSDEGGVMKRSRLFGG